MVKVTLEIKNAKVPQLQALKALGVEVTRSMIDLNNHESKVWGVKNKIISISSLEEDEIALDQSLVLLAFEKGYKFKHTYLINRHLPLLLEGGLISVEEAEDLIKKDGLSNSNFSNILVKYNIYPGILKNTQFFAGDLPATDKSWYWLSGWPADKRSSRVNQVGMSLEWIKFLFDKEWDWTSVVLSLSPKDMIENAPYIQKALDGGAEVQAINSINFWGMHFRPNKSLVKRVLKSIQLGILYIWDKRQLDPFITQFICLARHFKVPMPTGTYLSTSKDDDSYSYHGWVFIKEGTRSLKFHYDRGNYSYVCVEDYALDECPEISDEELNFIKTQNWSY